MVEPLKMVTMFALFRHPVSKPEIEALFPGRLVKKP
jgi:hypothetical protein